MISQHFVELAFIPVWIHKFTLSSAWAVGITVDKKDILATVCLSRRRIGLFQSVVFAVSQFDDSPIRFSKNLSFAYKELILNTSN